MKKLLVKIVLILIFCIPSLLFAQKVYSKDNIFLGDRSEFIDICSKAANNNKMINLKGIEIEINSYCACVCDQLMPKIYSWELEQAYKKNNLIDLFTKDKNLQIIIDCAASYVDIDDEFIFENKNFDEYSDLQKSVATKSCVLEAKKEFELMGFSEIIPDEMIKEYCLCALKKLFDEGYTMGQLNDITDEFSETFNEIALPCMQPIIFFLEEISSYISDDENEPINNYNKNDILGDKYMSAIKLNDFSGNYKIKINIDGIVKYFLFDTGATELFINKDIEKELISNGSLKKNQYISDIEVVLADNSVVYAKRFIIDNIKIGDYLVNNVVVAVLEEGYLLCGLGLLEKFRKWDFNKESEVLKIYK